LQPRIGTGATEQGRDRQQRAWIGAALDRLGKQFIGERVADVDRVSRFVFATHPAAA
jgi:hypothetical protein